MKRLFVAFTFLGIIQLTFSQETKRVLFLGNSYTASNNLPNLVSQMAANTGDVLIYDSNTPGGHRFMNHASNSTTLNKINADNWDFVALQGQSQETSFSETQMQNEVYPFATQLVNAIRTNNSCSQPLFYMTWGRENGDSQNCQYIPRVCTYEGMDDAIRNTYVFIAEENTSEIAPVGAVWRYIRTNHPEIDLYSGDGSHPSLAGSYAAACAFYTMIYKKDPTLITWNSSLSNTIANTIKQAAKLIVFDALNDWDFTANFDFIVNNNEVIFTNSYLADTVFWSFDDGNTSLENNPVHIYNSIGDFDVTLTITACGRTHLVTKTVSVSNLSLNHNNVLDVKIYPNPTKDNITIEGISNNFSVTLYSILGQKVKSFDKIINNTISLSEIKKGIYFLEIISDGNKEIKKIIKQ